MELKFPPLQIFSGEGAVHAFNLQLPLLCTFPSPGKSWAGEGIGHSGYSTPHGPWGTGAVGQRVLPIPQNRDPQCVEWAEGFPMPLFSQCHPCCPAWQKNQGFKSQQRRKADSWSLSQACFCITLVSHCHPCHFEAATNAMSHCKSHMPVVPYARLQKPVFKLLHGTGGKK